jgi:effector-binding domain-containing protein
MRRLLIIVSVVLVVLVLGLLIAVSMFKGPDLSKYESLKQPQIRTMESQKVIVVEAKGDPSVVGKEAFALLLKTYFKTKGVPKGRAVPAPRGRWLVSVDVPKTEWVGYYGMPVPETVVEIAELKSKSGLSARLEVWEYGEVAEILHVGPYDKEEPTVRKLVDFVGASGYRAFDGHEEEYLRGPTMFSRGDPARYVTIIRYRVAKTETDPES